MNNNLINQLNSKNHNEKIEALSKIIICAEDGFLWEKIEKAEAEKTFAEREVYKIYPDGSDGVIDSLDELHECVSTDFQIACELGFVKDVLQNTLDNLPLKEKLKLVSEDGKRILLFSSPEEEVLRTSMKSLTEEDKCNLLPLCSKDLTVYLLDDLSEKVRDTANEHFKALAQSGEIKDYWILEFNETSSEDGIQSYKSKVISQHLIADIENLDIKIKNEQLGFFKFYFDHIQNNTVINHERYDIGAIESDWDSLKHEMLKPIKLKSKSTSLELIQYIESVPENSLITQGDPDLLPQNVRLFYSDWEDAQIEYNSIRSSGIKYPELSELKEKVTNSLNQYTAELKRLIPNCNYEPLYKVNNFVVDSDGNIFNYRTWQTCSLRIPENIDIKDNIDKMSSLLKGKTVNLTDKEGLELKYKIVITPIEFRLQNVAEHTINDNQLTK